MVGACGVCFRGWVGAGLGFVFLCGVFTVTVCCCLTGDGWVGCWFVLGFCLVVIVLPCDWCGLDFVCGGFALGLRRFPGCV